MMKRVTLFLFTNIAVLLVLSFAVRLLGVDRFLGVSGIQLLPLLVFASIMGFAGSFISLAMSKWMAKSAYNIQVIQSPANDMEHWLLNTVQQLSKLANIPMPEVGVYESPEANAFATGPTKKNSIVAVSTGLLQQMSRQQVEGVLAHEVSHVANGDMVTMTLLQGIVNTFVIFLSRVVGYFIDRVVFKNEERVGMGYYLGIMISQVVFGILASIIVLSFSRRREFAADADAARLWGKGAMIDALEQLVRITSRGAVLDDRSKALASFKINHRQGRGITAWFASHPPLQDRIDALRQST